MKKSVLATLVVFGLAVSVQAEIITQPVGLNPGDQYRLVFVTSATRDAASNDISVYNNFVANAAAAVPELAALGTTWNVIATTDSDASDGGVFARDNIGGADSTPIYNLAGQVVAPNGTSNLWSTASTPSVLTNPINIDELGKVLDTLVWTGTSSDGDQWSSDSALGNTSSWVLDGSSGQTGGVPNVDSRFVQNLTVWNADIGNLTVGSNQGSFYAISGILTAQSNVVPEPASIALWTILGIFGVGFAFWRRKRK